MKRQRQREIAAAQDSILNHAHRFVLFGRQRARVKIPDPNVPAPGRVRLDKAAKRERDMKELIIHEFSRHFLIQRGDLDLGRVEITADRFRVRLARFREFADRVGRKARRAPAEGPKPS